MADQHIPGELLYSLAVTFLERRDPGIAERALGLSRAAAEKHVRAANRYLRNLREGGYVFSEAINEDDIFMDDAEPLKRTSKKSVKKPSKRGSIKSKK